MLDLQLCITALSPSLPFVAGYVLNAQCFCHHCKPMSVLTTDVVVCLYKCLIVKRNCWRMVSGTFGADRSIMSESHWLCTLMG